MIFAACCACHSNVPFRVKRLFATHWTDHNGTAPSSSEEAYRRVDLPDIDESARPNLDARIAFSICPHRGIVVHSCGEITKMCRRQGFARCRLEIQHIEGLVRRRDHVGVLLEVPEPATERRLRQLISRQKTF